MKFLLFFVTFCVANVSAEEFYNFVNEDREFLCNGNNIKWFLPNESKIFDNNSKYKIETINGWNSKLVIKNVNANDNGVYKCVSDGNPTISFNLKTYFHLTVDFTSTKTVKTNDTATLNCKTNGIPSATVKWFFEDVELKNSSNIEVHNDKIKLKNIQPDQAGSYACVAIQTLGTFKNIQQRDMELIVEHAPKKLDRAETIHGSIGEKITLRCQAHSVPTPSFRWLRNGYQVFQNIQIFNEVSELEVELQSKDSFDNYTCIASNEHGVQEHVFKIIESNDVISGSTVKSPFAVTFLMLLIAAFVKACFE